MHKITNKCIIKINIYLLNLIKCYIKLKIIKIYNILIEILIETQIQLLIKHTSV